MAQIQTVTGPIEDTQLGQTLIHEHLRVRSEEVVAQFPHLYDEEEEFRRAVKDVSAAKAKGIQTICDPTVMGLGRDVHFMERVARETGMQVVVATGIYTFHYLPPHFQNRPVDYMADLFVRDIEVGIQNTSIKAGFLKCATDFQGITPDVEKVIRAVARAHLRTGVPIMTHSHPATGTGLQQVELLLEEGVKPEAILIGHSGDTDSLGYLLRLLDTGVYIGMDRYGLVGSYGTVDTARKNATVAELAKRGYAERMFLSQDYCCTIDWLPRTTASQRSEWGMTMVVDKVIPALLEAGVTQEQIHTMMVENPRRWLTAGAQK